MKRCISSGLVGFAALALLACGDPGEGGMRGELGEGDRPGEPGAGGGMVGPEPEPGGTSDPVAPSGSSGREPTSGGAGGPSTGPGSGSESPSSQPGEVIEVPNLPEESTPVTSTDAFLGSRLRRLTIAEYTNTLRDLFGVNVDAATLPQDSRQSNFTRNESQAVDPVLGGHMQRVAQEVAASVVQGPLAGIVSCAAAGDRSCAQTFLEEFGPRIYRRPLESSEMEALLSLYDAGAEGQSDAFPSGMRVVLEAMLQSASFLYVSEVGGAAEPGEIVLLEPWELAASLSYLLTGHPPDEELRALAQDGTVLEPAVRRAQAERLLGAEGAELQIRRFIKEWLKLDAVATIDKADPAFAALRGPVETEADRFISEIAFRGDGRLSTMLTAGYSFVDPELAAFYGVQADASGRADLNGTGRIGLLQLSSFLAGNSQNEESGPIKRGVAVLRKLLCYDLPDPSMSDNPEVQNVMPPPRDDGLTTRERFAAHSENPVCATCHDVIDPIGFTFENFDAIGRVRDQDHGKPVDTETVLELGLSLDGPLVDSVDLSRKLAAEPRVKECFARHVYRNGMAKVAADAEATFIRGLSMTDDVKALLVELAASNSFLLRRLPTADEQL